ncbi:MAG TPA: MFS transporter [Candidatus Limnocylindria bacterium]|jgi:MFS family permease|nr:MFS transporter [Candidatus Limnocylindria bacterium]
MLASGVAVGILAGIAFGGDWRRLSTFNLKLWPILVLALALRSIGTLVPTSPLILYLVSLLGVAVVATWNWRIAGALLIAGGTTLNLLVVLLNAGMPYDVAAVIEVGAQPPHDGLHVPLGPEARLGFLSDVIPVALLKSVLSLGDFLVALGGFLIPFMWLQAPPQADRERHLRSPNFAFFWLGQAISRFGDPITLVGLAYVTYTATNSALWTASAVVIATVPNATFGFFGGAIADALGHRRVMLWCDLARALLLATVPLFIGIGAPLAIVFACVLVSGMCAAAFNPARVALVPTLLDASHLARGNSLVHATDRTLEIVGGLAGGLLVATIGASAFYVDAITFALSAMLLSRVAVHEPQRSRITWSRLLGDAQEGLTILRRSTVLWSNTLFSLAAQVSTPIINGLTPVLVIQRFAGSDASLGAAQYGGCEAAIAFGAVVGSALLPRYARDVRKGSLLVFGFAATGAVIILIAIAPSFPIAVVLFGFLGIANVLFYVPNVTILQEKTATAARARVLGARIALVNLSWLPLIVLSGILADAFGPALVIAIAGAITLGAALIGTRLRAVYDVA